MKKLIYSALTILIATFIFSCNSTETKDTKTDDSKEKTIEQLLEGKWAIESATVIDKEKLIADIVAKESKDMNEDEKKEVETQVTEDIEQLVIDIKNDFDLQINADNSAIIAGEKGTWKLNDSKKVITLHHKKEDFIFDINKINAKDLDFTLKTEKNGFTVSINIIFKK